MMTNESHSQMNEERRLIWQLEDLTMRNIDRVLPRQDGDALETNNCGPCPIVP